MIFRANNFLMCRKNKHFEDSFYSTNEKMTLINRKQNKAKETEKMQNKTLPQTQIVFSFQLILSSIEINYPSIAFYICLLAFEPNRSEIQKQNKKNSLKQKPCKSNLKSTEYVNCSQICVYVLLNYPSLCVESIVSSAHTRRTHNFKC